MGSTNITKPSCSTTQVSLGSCPCELLYAEASPMSVVNITAAKGDLGHPQGLPNLDGPYKVTELRIMKVCA